jgi:hypothetical protein
MKTPNTYDTREAWLRALARLLRSHFEKKGFALPDNIRFGVSFTSAGKKGNRTGECWHADASTDGTFEIFIRPDKSDPVEVAGILYHQLAHTVSEMGHGELFKAAARTLDLEGPMRDAMPNEWIREHVIAPALAQLPPLPHAELRFKTHGVNGAEVAHRPKPQKTRYLKAYCEAEGCPYKLRIVAACVAIGVPPCPVHGGVLAVERPAGGADTQD